MARRLLGGLLLLATAGVVGSGCVVEVSFDPFGDDFSAEGSWTINGEVPTADNCAAAGIDDVRIVFYDDGSPYFFDRLTFACEAGSFKTDRIFAYGSYTTEWQAVQSDGTVIKGPMLPLVVDAPITTVELASADFVTSGGFDPRGDDVSLSADWTINGMAANADLCSAAGIENVAIVLYDETDTGRTNGVTVAMAPCSDGKFDSRPMAILATGSYLTSIQALDGSGTVLASYDSESPFDISAVTHAMLMTAAFEADLTTSLTVNLSWDTDPSGTMVDGNCAEAGVGTFSYTLTDTSDDSVYDMMTEITCGTEIFWDEIPPGTYELFVEAKGDGAGWMVTCTDLLVEENRAEVYNCPVTRTM